MEEDSRTTPAKKRPPGTGEETEIDSLATRPFQEEKLMEDSLGSSGRDGGGGENKKRARMRMGNSCQWSSVLLLFKKNLCDSTETRTTLQQGLSSLAWLYGVYLQPKKKIFASLPSSSALLFFVWSFMAFPYYRGKGLWWTDGRRKREKEGLSMQEKWGGRRDLPSSSSHSSSSRPYCLPLFFASFLPLPSTGSNFSCAISSRHRSLSLSSAHTVLPFHVARK